MISNSQRAVDYFNRGYNCAQSVIAVFCDKYGLDKELSFKISSGLGGGFRSGEICGVVSGAVLVIGLKYGQYTADDIKAKRNCYAKTEEYINAFQTLNGAITCRDILGCDISTTKGREIAKHDNLFKLVCEDKVKNSVKLLEELGY